MHEQTLKPLLVEMDGFDPRKKLIVIAARARALPAVDVIKDMAATRRPASRPVTEGD